MVLRMSRHQLCPQLLGCVSTEVMDMGPFSAASE